MKASRFLLLLGILAVSFGGCRCDDGSLGGVELGFKVSGDTVDFGRAIEGSEVVREVELVSESRADVTVEASADSAFSVPARIVVPAGSVARLPVTFLAGNTKAQGTLTLEAAGKSVSLPLVGEGVHPLDCQPSAVCRVSKFDLASNSCVESPSNEGDPCVSANVCIENGSCRSGECVGTARTCDDQNLCTVDGCAANTGCVNAPIECPQPSNPCHVALCDPQTGCGEAFVQDGTPCGAMDCIKANLCISGTCQQVDTPEGFPCSPPTPCQGEGRCIQKVCTRPDAGTMSPAFSAVLPGALPQPVSDDAPTLIAQNGNLYFELCDGGCALTSYTETGFLRYSVRNPDGGADLLAVTDAGAFVSGSGQLLRHALSTGALRSSSDLSSVIFDPQLHAGALVVLSDGGVLALPQSVSDGGSFSGPLVFLEQDGGIEELVNVMLPGRTLLASTERDELFVLDETGLLTRLGDGSQIAYDAGAGSLVASNGALLIGGRAVVFADGGSAYLDWTSAGNERTPLSTNVLSSAGLGYVFATSCEPPNTNVCSAEELKTELRVLSLQDGTTRWTRTVLPPYSSAKLREAAVVDWAGGGVAMVSDASLDGGQQTYVQVVASGAQLFSCPIPDGAITRGAVFDRSMLYLVVQRGSSWRLEAYDLKGLPLEKRGWPQRNGVGGTRRAQ